jgi:hypothetical protein
MASSIQLLRSTTARERPIPGSLLEGQPAVNINAAEPGLFFKASDGTLVKIGPAAITDDGNPPNNPPAGYSGNSIGELWIDDSGATPILKVYNGAGWLSIGAAGPSPSGPIDGADIINGTVTRNKLATDTRVQKLDSVAPSFNGTTATFNITIGGSSVTPEYENAIMVFLGGIAQEPGVDFTVSGASLTFTTPPAAGLSFFAYYM